MIKVGITDDHKVVINGLTNMLQAFDFIHICGIYQSGTELLNGLKLEQPDILLLDIQLPDIGGEDLTEIITETYPKVKIIAMTGFSATFYVKSMLEKGAAGYLLKNTDEYLLIRAIDEVYHGKQFVDPFLSQQLIQSLIQDKRNEKSRPILTRKEKEVLKLIAEGLTSKEIAQKLFVSLRTVENQRVGLLHKFDVKNTVTLVRVAIDMGLV
jgi:DNA-binding NarL/FixJ family response regulator